MWSADRSSQVGVPLGPSLRSPFGAKNGEPALAGDKNIRMGLRGVYISENVC